MKKLKPGDRVVVKTGMHVNACGAVLRREGSVWIVRLDGGTTRQCMGSSLQKLPTTLRKLVP